MRRHAPATARNSEVIADVLEKELPKTGTVLEIASGTGEHAVFFARRFPDLDWQPTDLDAEALASIDAYAVEARLSNLRSALALNACNPPWPISKADAILCINMVHISPWDATVGLFQGAETLLPHSAPLILYGPYLEDEVETAPSNIAFDQSLKDRDGRWGLRHVKQIDQLANTHRFSRAERYTMPANNLVLVYRRA